MFAIYKMFLKHCIYAYLIEWFGILNFIPALLLIIFGKEIVVIAKICIKEFKYTSEKNPSRNKTDIIRIMVKNTTENIVCVLGLFFMFLEKVKFIADEYHGKYTEAKSRNPEICFRDMLKKL